MQILHNYIPRPASVITGRCNLELLHIFRNFPVFMGCTDQVIEKDIHADMEWAIDPESGIIQLTKLVPLEILYMDQHMDGTGSTWQYYNLELASFIKKHKNGRIVEIGGGSGKLAFMVKELDRQLEYTVVEPNPTFDASNQIKIVRSFFTREIGKRLAPETIVLSHVLEHVYDPYAFLSDLNSSLPSGGRFIFGYPNLEYLFNNKFTNAINFEHTMLMTDYFVDYFIKLTGFSIIEKTKYLNHSYFYCVEKCSEEKNGTKVELKSMYQYYKNMFIEFINYHSKLVDDINRNVANHDGEIFLFGAHIFSQYLLAFGLDFSRISCVLDNSPIKKGKRLYGSSLTVKSPEILRELKAPMVILKAGLYNDEIKNQIIKTINPKTKFI
jgi:hypothetical protein